MLEGVPFVNGSPQNTFVPGLIEMAIEKDVLIGATCPAALPCTLAVAALPACGVLPVACSLVVLTSPAPALAQAATTSRAARPR